MKKALIGTLIVILFVNAPFATAQQAAQPLREWNRLKAIPPADKLQVKFKSGESLTGRFLAASDTTLTLSRKNKPVDFDKDSILQVHRIVGRNSARSLLIGTGVGAATGAGIGAIIAAKVGGESGEEALPIFFFGLLGTGIGALIGGIAGKRQVKVMVYEGN